MIFPWRIAIVFVAVVILHTNTLAADVSANIEGINRTLMDTLRQIKTLQQEVQELRGEVELHAHTLNAMKTRQQEMSQDSDRRMTMAPSVTASPQSPSLPLAPIVAEPSIVQQPRPAAAAQPPRPLASTSSVSSNAEGQSAYDNAFNLLRSGSYDEAIKGFRDFLAIYPEGQLAANSQYWIGEAYYVTRRFKEAMPEFQRIIDGYPDSSKTGDALLKLGYIQYELNQTAEAKKSLEEVIARFPQSTAAKLASARLAKMKH
ncbi:Cell division coordinator CpoB [Gammaproteobacteria bacterium]